MEFFIFSNRKQELLLHRCSETGLVSHGYGRMLRLTWGLRVGIKEKANSDIQKVTDRIDISSQALAWCSCAGFAGLLQLAKAELS